MSGTAIDLRLHCTLPLSFLHAAFRPHPHSLSKGEGGHNLQYLFNFHANNSPNIFWSSNSLKPLLAKHFSQISQKLGWRGCAVAGLMTSQIWMSPWAPKLSGCSTCRRVLALKRLRQAQPDIWVSMSSKRTWKFLLFVPQPDNTTIRI